MHQKRLIVFSAIVFLSFIFVPSTIAQTESAAQKEKRQNALEKQLEIKKQTQERMTAIRETRQATRAAILEQKKELRETIMQKREEAKELFKAKRETLKLKIAQIKDERKKVVLERIDNKLSAVNTNRIDAMTANLEKLSSILTKITEQANTAKANEKNTAILDAAIITAQSSITSAKSIVATQAGKEYVITITTEQALKSAVGKTTSQLQADLQIAHKTVVDAKQAVQKAAAELAKITKVEKPTVSTNSTIQE
ncbi:MAG: hypothetical protein HYV37_00460 [Candidatus Levyibacteriota bacterium]|nr:MAG: hypothetical protein HYV37_00460 [Candidatus Levybacteria bacterium]